MIIVNFFATLKKLDRLVYHFMALIYLLTQEIVITNKVWCWVE